MAKKKIKRPKYSSSTETTKKPKLVENPDYFMKENPAWSFSKCDKNHSKWSLCKCAEIWDDVISKLSNFETQTWAEIFQASGGRRCGTLNHFIEVENLCTDAKKRLSELKLDQVEQVFSFSLTGKQRLIGLLQGKVFFLLWWDSLHEVCPSHKKNT